MNPRPGASKLTLSLLLAALPISLLVGCGSGGTEASDGGGGTGASLGAGGTVGAGGGATGGGGSPGVGGSDTGTGASSATGGATSASGPRVFGYVYELGAPIATNVEALPFENVDYVVHAFVTADAAGNVVPVDNFDEHRTAGLVERAHAAGKRVVLSLGGAGSTWQLADLIGTPAQDTFVQNVASRITEWGYDGVDFDFEFPGADCTPAEFTEFLQKLRTAVKAESEEHLVMFGISPGWWLGSYEWASLGAIADYGFYFCYDWNNPERGPVTRPEGTPLWSMQSGEQIEPSCRGALDYITAAGFPVGKLVVGYPFAAANGTPFRSASDAARSGTPDEYSMEVFADGTYWTNVASIEAKVGAVLDPGASVLSGGAVASGVGFWQWGEEDFGGSADLSTAMRQAVDAL